MRDMTSDDSGLTQMPVLTFNADGWADPEPDGADISGLSLRSGDLNAVTEAGHHWSLVSRHWSHCLRVRLRLTRNW